MKAKINVTIDKELLARIQQMREEEKRNLSNMVECLLYKAIEDR